MRKRHAITFVVYAVLICGTAVFLTLSFLFQKAFLQNLAGTFLIAWIPAVFCTVLAALPQTIAGNIFQYVKCPDPDKRREKLDAHCSAEMIDSEMYRFLLDRKDYSKPCKVTPDRNNPSPGKRVYLVQLRDFNRYRVVLAKRDPERDLHETSRWVVESIEEVKK